METDLKTTTKGKATKACEEAKAKVIELQAKLAKSKETSRQQVKELQAKLDEISTTSSKETTELRKKLSKAIEITKEATELMVNLRQEKNRLQDDHRRSMMQRECCQEMRNKMQEALDCQTSLEHRLHTVKQREARLIEEVQTKRGLHQVLTKLIIEQEEKYEAAYGERLKRLECSLHKKETEMEQRVEDLQQQLAIAKREQHHVVERRVAGASQEHQVKIQQQQAAKAKMARALAETKAKGDAELRAVALAVAGLGGVQLPAITSKQTPEQTPEQTTTTTIPEQSQTNEHTTPEDILKEMKKEKKEETKEKMKSPRGMMTTNSSVATAITDAVAEVIHDDVVSKSEDLKAILGLTQSTTQATERPPSSESVKFKLNFVSGTDICIDNTQTKRPTATPKAEELIKKPATADEKEAACVAPVTVKEDIKTKGKEDKPDDQIEDSSLVLEAANLVEAVCASVDKDEMEAPQPEVQVSAADEACGDFLDDSLQCNIDQQAAGMVDAVLASITIEDKTTTTDAIESEEASPPKKPSAASKIKAAIKSAGKKSRTALLGKKDKKKEDKKPSSDKDIKTDKASGKGKSKSTDSKKPWKKSSRRKKSPPAEHKKSSTELSVSFRAGK